MPIARDLDAVFYSEDVPNVFYRNGSFHVSYAIRECYFEFVMPPSVFKKAIVLAEGAMAEWRLDQMPATPDLVGNVRQFKRRKKS